MFVPDDKHLLIMLQAHSSGVVTGISGITPFQSGVRMDIRMSFVVGAQHEFRGGIIASVRYIDAGSTRHRDEGGISVEQSTRLL